VACSESRVEEPLPEPIAAEIAQTVELEVEPAELPDSAELEKAPPIYEAEQIEPESIPEVAETGEPARSAFDGFIEALVAVLLASGATRAAAALPVWLRSGRIEAPLADLPLLRSDELGTTLEAWRAVLAGTSGDLSACGASTLDRWAAELLAIVLGAPPARVEELRRDLRRRGVAAFGMLDAA
jgi:hypothetical protein